MILFYLGVIYEGYCSDITRTVSYKSISNEQKKIYQTALEAEQKSINISKIGIEVREVDLAARKNCTLSNNT